MTAPVSTPESRTAALSMFEGQVPCVFQLAEPPCAAVATWLAHLAHEENTVSCEASPLPVCDAHRQAVEAASHPFWRTWQQLAPALCDRCGTPVRAERFEPL